MSGSPGHWHSHKHELRWPSPIFNGAVGPTSTCVQRKEHADTEASANRLHKAVPLYDLCTCCSDSTVLRLCDRMRHPARARNVVPGAAHRSVPQTHLAEARWHRPGQCRPLPARAALVRGAWMGCPARLLGPDTVHPLTGGGGWGVRRQGLSAPWCTPRALLLRALAWCCARGESRPHQLDAWLCDARARVGTG